MILKKAEDGAIGYVLEEGEEKLDDENLADAVVFAFDMEDFVTQKAFENACNARRGPLAPADIHGVHWVVKEEDYEGYY